MAASRLLWRITPALVLVAAAALAQTKAKPSRSAPSARPKTTRPAVTARPATPAASAGPARNEPDTSSAAANVAPMSGRGEAKPTAASNAPAGKEGGGDAGVVVVDKDGGTKQFKFGETDIEGRLKAPQLVYFLRRVRAEFAAGDLGHRSFLRELSETKRDPNF